MSAEVPAPSGIEVGGVEKPLTLAQNEMALKLYGRHLDKEAKRGTPEGKRKFTERKKYFRVFDKTVSK